MAPRFPEAKQLVGEDNWREYKREVLLAVQSHGLKAYLEGTIVKLTAMLLINTQTPTNIFSKLPLPEEWVSHNAIITSIIVTNIVDPVSLGLDEDETSAVIWTALVSRFEKCNEQKIHLADSALHKCIYNTDTTMEEHERKMQNLLKCLHNTGEWKPDVRNVPGTDSESAFTFLHALYLEKKDEADEEERDLKKVKVLLAKNPNVYASVMQTQGSTGDQASNDCACFNCRKLGHNKANCWGPGGGKEGQAPKWWRGKGKVKSQVQAVAAPEEDINVNNIDTDPDASELYVLEADVSAMGNDKQLPF
ncbi:hypothetical protein GYMLUDRAFT_242322 [Collybiopsis luxurians FD-317 M1]|uniref:CCHC-type domain-containing protein n=1 Tax=Collybiopsis luxurians FD-317 M1 TaxID=944289 RepID=A0A0D0D0V4_9AGAR|nr:hypothetical protein GYMLUDRAFT_242322 [Collybiopsis luxurians FD-317 M1]